MRFTIFHKLRTKEAIDQFWYNSNSIDLSARLRGTTAEFLELIPQSFVLRSVVLALILIYWNWFIGIDDSIVKSCTILVLRKRRKISYRWLVDKVEIGRNFYETLMAKMFFQSVNTAKTNNKNNSERCFQRSLRRLLTTDFLKFYWWRIHASPAEVKYESFFNTEIL